jgi:hypothetical protein
MNEEFKFEKLIELEERRFKLNYGNLLQQVLLGLGGFLVVIFQLLFEAQNLLKGEERFLKFLLFLVIAGILVTYGIYDLQKSKHLSQIERLYKKYQLSS